MTARLHLNIGLLYERWNSELSVNYLKKALKDSQLNRDSSIQHLALVQLAEASLAAQDTAQALLYAEQVGHKSVSRLRGRGPSTWKRSKSAPLISLEL